MVLGVVRQRRGGAGGPGAQNASRIMILRNYALPNTVPAPALNACTSPLGVSSCLGRSRRSQVMQRILDSKEASTSRALPVLSPDPPLKPEVVRRPTNPSRLAPRPAALPPRQPPSSALGCAAVPPPPSFRPPRPALAPARAASRRPRRLAGAGSRRRAATIGRAGRCRSR